MALINPKPSNIFETYDYLDTATGLGYKRYFPFVVSGATGTTEYRLTDQAIKSGKTSLSISGAFTTGAMHEWGHWDFDQPFFYQLDNPRIIEGDAFISVCQGHYNFSPATFAAQQMKTAVEFYLVRNGTATFLCSGSSLIWGHEKDYYQGGSPPKQATSKDLCIKTTFPKTRLKKNDTLRARFIMYYRNNGFAGDCGPYNIGMGCDPLGRADVEPSLNWSFRIVNAISGSTCTTIDIPFKIIR